MNKYLKITLISAAIAFYFALGVSYMVLESFEYLLHLGIVALILGVSVQYIGLLLTERKRIAESTSLILTFAVYYSVVMLFLLVLDATSEESISMVSSPSSWFYEVLILTIMPLVLGLWNLEVKLFNVNYRSVTFEDHGEGQDNNITISSESTKKELSIDVEELIMIEAEDNYCMIFFQREEGIRKELFRSTLKKMHDQLLDVPGIHRVHRSFLVNEKHVDRIAGKSQNYKIYMNDIDKVVPVSRTFDISSLKQN